MRLFHLSIPKIRRATVVEDSVIGSVIRVRVTVTVTITVRARVETSDELRVRVRALCSLQRLLAVQLDARTVNPTRHRTVNAIRR